MARPKGTRKIAPGKNATGFIAAQGKKLPKEKRPVDRRAASVSSDASRRRPSRDLLPGVDQRAWTAVWVASVLSTLGMLSLVYSFTEDLESSAVLALRLVALAAVPLAYILLAWISRTPQLWRSVGIATLVFLAVGMAAFLPFLFGVEEAILFGLTLPLGAGGVFALNLKRPEAMRLRVVFVVTSSILGFLLLAAIPSFGIVMAPLLPFTSLLAADVVAERRAQRAATGSG